MEAVKQAKRRRSSFTARRVSLIVPSQDVGTQLETPVEELHSEAGSCPSSSQDSSDSQGQDYTPEQAEIAAEIHRFKEECSDWDQLVADTEKEAMVAKQKASEIVPLRDEDVPKEIKFGVDELIGQVPNYSAILQELYQRANEAVGQLDEVAQVIHLVEEVVQETDRRFTKYADILGELSLPKMETPRTNIRQRLAISTPKV